MKSPSLTEKTWLAVTKPCQTKKDFADHLKKQVEKNRQLADSILSMLPSFPSSIVDIGAGYGGLAINFALKGILTKAIEPSKRHREVIRNLLKKNPQAKKYLSIITGVAEKLPVKNKSIDLCICSQVLEHVNDPQKTFQEITRVLKPSGYCYLNCPNYLFPYEQHYNLPYFPLMSKPLFSFWAITLFKYLNIRGIPRSTPKDFSKVRQFIYELNYITNAKVNQLCQDNKLGIVYSSSLKKRQLNHQIKQHWQQNPSFSQILFIILSLPLKVTRCFLTLIGILPVKLEYLIQK